MNSSLISLSLSYLSPSPLLTLSLTHTFSLKSSFLHHFFQPFLFTQTHSFGLISSSSFEYFLSHVFNLDASPRKILSNSSWTFNHDFFANLYVDGDGSAILSKNSNVSILSTDFLNNTSTGNGASLFAQGSIVRLECDRFQLGRTIFKDHNIGGNAFRCHSSNSKVSDLFLFKCWETIECGDEGYCFYSGSGEAKRINVTASCSYLEGEPGGTFFYPPDGTMFSFLNEIQVRGHSTFYTPRYSGNPTKFIIEKMNIINSTYKYGILYANINVVNANECCFFKNNPNCFHELVKCTSCVGDFSTEGVSKLERISTQKVIYGRTCKYKISMGFSMKGKVKLKIGIFVNIVIVE